MQKIIHILVVGLLFFASSNLSAKGTIDVSDYPEAILGYWLLEQKSEKAKSWQVFQYLDDNSWVEKSYFYPKGENEIFYMAKGSWSVDKDVLMYTTLKATHGEVGKIKSIKIISISPESLILRDDDGNKFRHKRFDNVVELSKTKKAQQNAAGNGENAAPEL